MNAFTFCVCCLSVASGFQLAPVRLAAHGRAPTAQMLGGGGEGGFMDKMKAAQQMFNPEMMKKYSEVGQKVQALQEELAQTEIECATSDGGVVVKVTGTQVPISIEVTQALCDAGCYSR